MVEVNLIARLGVGTRTESHLNDDLIVPDIMESRYGFDIVRPITNVAGVCDGGDNERTCGVGI